MAEKVLITGGAGFIGLGTANRLISLGYDVRVFDNLNKQIHPDPRESLSRLDPKVELICGDVRDRAALQAALEGVEVVYHFAAETGVGQSMYEIERYSEVTIQGTAVLCDCIIKKRGRIKKIILSSSRAVYGEGQYRCKNCSIVYPEPRSSAQLNASNWDSVCPQCGAEITPVPCQETSPCHPISIYGITKKVQEDLLNIVSKTYKIQVVILRYFNVFGGGQCVSNPYTGVLSIFTSRMLLNKDIEIYEDGQMQRDFVSIQEVVNSNVKALELGNSGMLILNVGSGKPRTIMQLAECLKKEINSKSSINMTGRYRIGDIRHCFADISKTNDFIGQLQKDSFKQGIKDLVNWIRNKKITAPLEQSITELSDYALTGTAVATKTNKRQRY